MSAVNDDLDFFWAEARAVHPHLPEALPEAWAFGATPEHATAYWRSC